VADSVGEIRPPAAMAGPQLEDSAGLIPASPVGSSMDVLAKAAKIAELQTRTNMIFETEEFKPTEAPKAIPVIVKGSHDRLRLNCFKRGWNNFVTCCGRHDCCFRCQFKLPRIYVRKSRMSSVAHMGRDRDTSASPDSIYRSLSGESGKEAEDDEVEVGVRGGGTRVSMMNDFGSVRKQSLGGNSAPPRPLPRSRKRGRGLARPDSASMTMTDIPIARMTTSGAWDLTGTSRA